MRIVLSRLPRTTITIPKSVPGVGGFEVRFVNGRGVVPDAVAEYLLDVETPGNVTTLRDSPERFYRDGGIVADAVQNASVLVVRDTGLGDVLMTTPLIRKLHTEKNATVDVLTHERYCYLFDGNPHVRQICALETVGENEAALFAEYDVVLDLRLVVENAEFAGVHQHRADAFAAFGDFTMTELERRPDYYLTANEKAEASKEVHGFLSPNCKAVIGYVWESSTSNRNWSEATHTAVLSALVGAGYGLVLLGDVPSWGGIPPFSHPFNNDPRLFDLINITTVRQVASVLSACDAVVTPDTGLFHLAAALDVPTLAYFGAFPIEERKAHRLLVVGNAPAAVCPLAPCRSYRCFNRDDNHQPVCLSVSTTGDLTRSVDMLIQTAKEIFHVEPKRGDAVGRTKSGRDAQTPDRASDNENEAGRRPDRLGPGPDAEPAGNDSALSGQPKRGKRRAARRGDAPAIL